MGSGRIERNHGKDLVKDQIKWETVGVVEEEKTMGIIIKEDQSG